MESKHYYKYLKYKAKYLSLLNNLKLTGGTDNKDLRPSPTASATLYKTGTKKNGNDGNQWIIVEDKNGVKRWKLHRKKNYSKKNNEDDTERENEDEEESDDITTEESDDITTEESEEFNMDEDEGDDEDEESTISIMDEDEDDEY